MSQYTPDAWIERNADDPDDIYAEQQDPELEYAYDDLERTEATTDYFDHFFPRSEPLVGDGGDTPVRGECLHTSATVGSNPIASDLPTFEEQQAYWESDAFLSGHNGEQPHED